MELNQYLPGYSRELCQLSYRRNKAENRGIEPLRVLAATKYSTLVGHHCPLLSISIGLVSGQPICRNASVLMAEDTGIEPVLPFGRLQFSKLTHYHSVNLP